MVSYKSILLIGSAIALAFALPHEVAFGKRLISTAEDKAEWLAEEQIFDLYKQGIKFIDITDGDLDVVSVQSVKEKKKYSSDLSQEVQVAAIVANLSGTKKKGQESKELMKQFLTTFSSFRTRYYKSSAGKESQKWLLNQVKQVAESSKTTDTKITVNTFEHEWGQHSIVARIELVNSTEQQIVIVGAHQDSVNQWNPWFGRSPGADDDGSGTTTTFEAFRLLVEHEYKPTRPLEFHWYSAEEGGLLGSQKVASKYKSDGADVLGMFQVDMTGYKRPNKKEVIGIATDFTDPHVSDVLRKVVEKYCKIGWVNTKCGYGCSDHASWNKLGYPATFSFESEFNDHSPYIHTVEDTVEHIDFNHVLEFVKAVVGWAMEMCKAQEIKQEELALNEL